jgi:hypothetical protein
LGIFQRRNKQEYVKKGRWRKKELGSENDLAQRDLSSGVKHHMGSSTLESVVGKGNVSAG